MKARKRAAEADVIVVNHHLFFADVALRDEGAADLLPAANTVIFDEAHHLPDLARLFFGESLSTAQLRRARARRAHRRGAARAREHRAWATPRDAVERAARDVRLALGNAVGAHGARRDPRPRGLRRGARRARRARSRALVGEARRRRRSAPRRSSNCRVRADECLGAHRRVARGRRAPASEDAYGEPPAATSCAGSRPIAHSAVLYVTPLDVGAHLPRADGGRRSAPGSSPRPRSR